MHESESWWLFSAIAMSYLETMILCQIESLDSWQSFGFILAHFR
jgi:hypothetical protein